jgi:hypothetical protein
VPSTGLRVERHAEGISAWDSASQPFWLTAEVFLTRIQPLLAGASSSAIKATIRVSSGYAGRIRQGYRPHPRHWQALAKLVDELEASGELFPASGRGDCPVSGRNV